MTQQADEQTTFSKMLMFVQEAAALALDKRAAGLTTTYKGEGFGQSLTEADATISKMMHTVFGKRLIEEETANALSAAEARELVSEDEWTFIGDPIDGTAPFAAGLPGWGVMIAACRGGWPRMSAIILPAWIDERDTFDRSVPPAQQRGLLLAALDRVAYSAPTLHGKMIQPLRPIWRQDIQTRHVGWLPIAAKHYTLDYTKGFFPISESGYVADAAALAIGKLDATTFNSKLWDLAPTLPILEALGFQLYRWPYLERAPANIADLFDNDYACHPDMWLICKSLGQACLFAKAVARSAIVEPS